jgi:putative molybdopterin biosynthesis protein
MEVALIVLKREADVGLGIQAAAISCGLDFIPVAKEKFDLIIPISNYISQTFVPILRIIHSDEYKRVVREMGGYDVSQTGETVLVK